MNKLWFHFFFLLGTSAAMAQMQPPQFGQVYLETAVQNKQRITGIQGANVQLSTLSAGIVLPVFSQIVEHNTDVYPPSRLTVILHPSLTYSLLDINYLPQQRLLLNTQLSVGSYYTFKHKNKLFANIKALLNEDEFTFNNPKLRYAFSGMYSRKTTYGFSYYAGATYSYVFGEGRWFPLLGTHFSWGNGSHVNIILPLVAVYQKPISSKLKFSAYVRPQGGINRFENRLTISDSTQHVLVLRRRSVALGAAFSCRLKNNISITIDPAFLLAQKISFTDETGSHKFMENNLSRGFQVRVMLVWRPWQNNLRNQQHSEKELQDDEHVWQSF